MFLCLPIHNNNTRKIGCENKTDSPPQVTSKLNSNKIETRRKYLIKKEVLLHQHFRLGWSFCLSHIDYLFICSPTTTKVTRKRCIIM